MIEVSIEPRQLTAGRDCDLKIKFSNAGPGTCSDVVFKLGLPPEFFLLRGRDRIKIPELGSGGTWVQDVTVRARKAGGFAVTSDNFSYRNEFGTPVRVSDFRAGLTVTPAMSPPPPAGPDLDVTLASGALIPDEWDVLRIKVRNASQSPLLGITMTVDGPVRIAPRGSLAEVPDLAAGQEAEISFIACPTETGNSVPAQVRLTYHDGHRVRSQQDIMPLTVRNPAATAWTPQRDAGVGRDTVLFLAASPSDMFLLRSDLEIRGIREQLQLGKFRAHFRLESAVAARLKDIGQALADYDPRIVHFSGHGGQDGSLYVEDESGYSVPAAPEGLARLFRLHSKTVDCVIVNACHSLRLAQAMQSDFDYVIAMQTKISDNAAINFSIGFYQGLASGDPVPLAFERGASFLQSLAVGPAEHETPILVSRDGTR
jgi:CHAT domain